MLYFPWDIWDDKVASQVRKELQNEYIVYNYYHEHKWSSIFKESKRISEAIKYDRNKRFFRSYLTLPMVVLP